MELERKRRERERDESRRNAIAAPVRPSAKEKSLGSKNDRRSDDRHKHNNKSQPAVIKEEMKEPGELTPLQAKESPKLELKSERKVQKSE